MPSLQNTIKLFYDTHPFGGTVFFGDPYGTRTHVTAVKGRCLNHLTNGPKTAQPDTLFCCAVVESGGLEPSTFRV